MQKLEICYSTSHPQAEPRVSKPEPEPHDHTSRADNVGAKHRYSEIVRGDSLKLPS
jgi:hypothetical protein